MLYMEEEDIKLRVKASYLGKDSFENKKTGKYSMAIVSFVLPDGSTLGNMNLSKKDTAILLKQVHGLACIDLELVDFKEDEK